MYGYTKSTPVDRTYRFSRAIEITLADEGAAVYRWSRCCGYVYVGCIINQRLVRPL